MSGYFWNQLLCTQKFLALDSDDGARSDSIHVSDRRVDVSLALVDRGNDGDVRAAVCYRIFSQSSFNQARQPDLA